MTETLVVNSSAVASDLSLLKADLPPRLAELELEVRDFSDFFRYSYHERLAPNAIDFLRKGFSVWTGVGELRGRSGPYLYARTGNSLAAGEALNLVDFGRSLHERYPNAQLVVEPRFTNVPLAYFRQEPMESIRNVKFRLVSDGHEVFRADLRQGNRSHSSSLRVFAFNHDFELAHELTKKFLGRKLNFGDLDPDIANSFREGRSCAVAESQRVPPDLMHAGAPPIDFDHGWFEQYSYPYTLTRLPQAKVRDTAEALDQLGQTLYRHALAYRDFEVLGAENDAGVFMLKSYGARVLRAIQSFIEDSAGLLAASQERHPMHHLWVGVKLEELSPRTFMAQAIALERRNPQMRFEVREMMPLLTFEEFSRMASHPECVFKMLDSDLFRNRTISSLNGLDGFFVQFNPVAQSAQGQNQQQPFFHDQAGAQDCLSRCQLIIGRTHPNLPERWRLHGLIPGVINEGHVVKSLLKDTLLPPGAHFADDPIGTLDRVASGLVQDLLARVHLK